MTDTVGPRAETRAAVTKWQPDPDNLIEDRLAEAGVDPWIMEVLAPLAAEGIAASLIEQAFAAYRGQEEGQDLTMADCTAIVAGEAILAVFLRGIAIGRELG